MVSIGTGCAVVMLNGTSTRTVQYTPIPPPTFLSVSAVSAVSSIQVLCPMRVEIR